MPSATSIGSAPASADVRAVIAAVVLGSILVARAAPAADEAPDAQLLLDLDLLSQAEPHERDLMRRLPLVERLRLLELLRVLDSRTSERRPAVEESPR
jgi:hypothetical protein